MNNFEDITAELNKIYLAKNADYGNSFEQTMNEFGLTAAIIRLSDKLNRLKSLAKSKQAQVEDESIRDTLKDLANYAILTIDWLDRNGVRSI